MRIEYQAGQEGSRAEYRVLLVEDDPAIAALVLAFLNDENRVELMVATDGDQGVEAFRSSTFDLVLMDIAMPGRDGYSAIEAMRQWEVQHSLPRIPIVALTASTYSDEIARMFALGCTRYLPKPVTKPTLVHAVKQLIGT